jgi:hypothetical protein
MSQKILQINYKFSIPADELEQGNLAGAQMIGDTAGLNWKIWLVNEAASEGGGIYLFEDESAAQAFVDGPIVAGLRAMPVVSDVRIKLFGVSEPPTRVTRGPIGEGVRV